MDIQFVNYIYIGILGIIASLLIRFIYEYMKQIALKKVNIYNEKEKKLINEYSEKKLENINNEIYKDHFKSYFNLLLLNQNSKLDYNLLPKTKMDIEAKADKDFHELKKRIEEIEKRFPKDENLVKIASNNDAIFLTKIEELSKAIDKLEKKQLNKWDVVVILFAVLGALGVIIGILGAVVKYIIM